VAIIHLVQPLPTGSSDLPGGRSEPKSASGGQPFDASLFGLAPRGVCLAAHVTTRAGALLPHHFTHHPFGLVYFLLHLSSPNSPNLTIQDRQAPRR